MRRPNELSERTYLGRPLSVFACDSSSRAIFSRFSLNPKGVINNHDDFAISVAIFTPLAETIRRWTWRENPPALLDDYILGAFLLYGAWRVGKDVRSGQRFLAAAWAFMCGMAFLSFFDQVYHYRLGITEPAPIPSIWVALIKMSG